MRVPLDWLEEFVELPADAGALAERLTSAGFEIEGVERLAVPERVVVGAIASVEPLAGRDGLTRCRVAVGEGEGEGVEVVCGAPGVAAGQIVPVALAGAVLPAGAVAEREVHGLRSAAVLCSERDLGLGDDHSGLLELRPGEISAAGGARPTALGTPLSAVLPELVVLDVAVAPNRGDCLSVLGIAREIAALYAGKLRTKRQATPVADDEDGSFAVAIEDAHELCRWYCAQRFRAPQASRAPFWMRRRLLACGVRPIGPAVDVTNYVMLERGHPLHAFDLDRVQGARLVARRARAGESLRLLDGRDVALVADDLVIADGRAPVALAGVMGGEGTEVCEATQRLVLEAAVFQPATVRRSAKRLGIHTEASHRFERGVDPTGAAAAVARAAALLASLGSRPLGRILEAGGPPSEPAAIPFVPKRVNALLGTSVEAQEMVRRLRAIGATVRRTHGETIEVTAPPHRLDLRQPADLAEEVARVGGYEAIPTVAPRIAARGRSGAASEVRRLQNAFAAHGFAEAVVLAFADPAENERFPGLWPADTRSLTLVNPLATVARDLRRSLLPGLLAALRVNRARGETFVPLFAIGTVFATDAGGRGLERPSLAALVAGMPPQQIGAAPPPVAFADVKGIVEAVLGDAGIAAPDWAARRDVGFLHPGKAADLHVGDRLVGWVGAAHPAIAAAHDVRGDLWLVELEVAGLLAARRPTPRYVEAPRFPAIERDAALIVDEDLPAGALRDALLAMRHPLVENVILFDEYRGAGVPAGRKSLAYTISYRAPDRTLTDTEVNAAHEDLLRTLAAAFSFERRGVGGGVVP